MRTLQSDYASDTYVSLTLADLSDLLEETISDYYDLFYKLAEKYVFVIADGDSLYYSWCKDTRFNYRDKLIYVPYLAYEACEVPCKQEHKHLDTYDGQLTVRYNISERILPIYCKELNILNPRLIFFDPNDCILYTVDITALPLFDASKSFSITELYSRFVDASYFDEVWEDIDFDNTYHWISSNKGKNLEYAYRIRHNLPSFENKLKYTDMLNRLQRYNDIRLYNYSVLNATIDNCFNTNMEYWERKFRFEAYLLLAIASNKSFIEENWQRTWNKVGVTLNHAEYCGITGFPMYLKHYYKYDSNFKRRSYERYLDSAELRSVLSLILNKEC